MAARRPSLARPTHLVELESAAPASDLAGGRCRRARSGSRHGYETGSPSLGRKRPHQAQTHTMPRRAHTILLALAAWSRAAAAAALASPAPSRDRWNGLGVKGRLCSSEPVMASKCAYMVSRDLPLVSGR